MLIFTISYIIGCDSSHRHVGVSQIIRSLRDIQENVSQGGGERGRLFEGVAMGNIYNLLKAMYVILGIMIRMVELLCAALRCDIAFILQSHIWGLNYMNVFLGNTRVETHRQRSCPYLVIN